MFLISNCLHILGSWSGGEPKQLVSGQTVEKPPTLACTGRLVIKTTDKNVKSDIFVQYNFLANVIIWDFAFKSLICRQKHNWYLYIQYLLLMIVVLWKK